MTIRAERFSSIRESIFARMTREAQTRNAVNLAQGFPDFDGPTELISRLHSRLDSTTHQYTRSSGHLELCHALHSYAKDVLPRAYDPVDEITVVNGATEGIFCTIMGLVNPKKKILVFEPYYESYLACARMAGAELIGVPLVAPTESAAIENGHWQIDWHNFEQAMSDDVALIMLNHPHNPTGKVFDTDELDRIFAHARKRGIPVAIDGVYENLVFPPHDQSFIRFPAAYCDEAIFISSISKTLSFTGFKIGWVFAPKKYMAGIRAAHEATVFCLAPYLQLAVADILKDADFLHAYLARQHDEFVARRDAMRKILIDFGFNVPNPQGAYFLMAQKHCAPLQSADDTMLASEILDRYGIAMLPVSGFFVENSPLKDWLRIAFCKRLETIKRVSEILLPSG